MLTTQCSTIQYDTIQWFFGRGPGFVWLLLPLGNEANHSSLCSALLLRTTMRDLIVFDSLMNDQIMHTLTSRRVSDPQPNPILDAIIQCDTHQ